MNGRKFILSKQQNWARRKGFELVPGTIGSNGEKNYVNELNQNLFVPLSAESMTRYGNADGNETTDGEKRLAKMKALHSSSALVVNMFQYWQGKDLYPLLAACKLPTTKTITKVHENVGSKTDSRMVEVSKPLEYTDMRFEEKFEISPDKSLFPRTPNIDVLVHGDFDFAFESKFTEPYGGKHDGLKAKYVEDESLWDGLPNLYKLAKEISPYNNKFRYLDAAQLIKHILGLKQTSKRELRLGERKLEVAVKRNFYLVYLWYDVLGRDGFWHQEEINQFAAIAEKDNIHFKAVTYQEVIANLSEYAYMGNEAYCDYLTERYL